MIEACEHHRIKRLCAKCNPRPRKPAERKAKARVVREITADDGEKATYLFVQTEEGLLVRRKHCRVKNTKLYSFETLVSLLDFTFTARAQAKGPEVKPPEQTELFPAPPEPNPQPELSLT